MLPSVGSGFNRLLTGWGKHIICQGRLLISYLDLKHLKLWQKFGFYCHNFNDHVIVYEKFSHYFDSISVNEHEDAIYASLMNSFVQSRGRTSVQWVQVGNSQYTALDDLSRQSMATLKRPISTLF